jgi:hypothetical protein
VLTAEVLLQTYSPLLFSLAGIPSAPVAFFGENVVYDPSNHPSITAIHENNSIELNGKFGFQKVTSEKVEKIMNKINVKKATGADGIPAKLNSKGE